MWLDWESLHSALDIWERLCYVRTWASASACFVTKLIFPLSSSTPVTVAAMQTHTSWVVMSWLPRGKQGLGCLYCTVPDLRQSFCQVQTLKIKLKRIESSICWLVWHHSERYIPYLTVFLVITTSYFSQHVKFSQASFYSKSGTWLMDISMSFVLENLQTIPV